MRMELMVKVRVSTESVEEERRIQRFRGDKESNKICKNVYRRAHCS